MDIDLFRVHETDDERTAREERQRKPDSAVDAGDKEIDLKALQTEKLAKRGFGQSRLRREQS